MPIAIGGEELVVGNVASKPRVAYFAPETFAWDQHKKGVRQVWTDHRFSESLAIEYQIPDEISEYWRDKPRGGTVGHFVADYERILRKGFEGLRRDIEEHRRRLDLKAPEDREKEVFYQAADIACQAAVRFAERHAATAREMAACEAETKRRTELEQIARVCERVPAQPAATFREALQAFWLTHVMLHINSQEWSISPGRFDQYMLPYYERDIAEGRMTREEARELLACLWIKFNEVRIAVDFINYQNLIVGGQNDAGADSTNDLSYLCLDLTSRLRTFQPSLSVRWHPGAPAALVEKSCEMIRSGLSLPALFNDLAVISALQRAGVALHDARNYAIAGCSEIAVPGKLFGVIRAGPVNLAKCVLYALFNGRDPYSERREGAGRPLPGGDDGAATGQAEDFKDFGQLMRAYEIQARRATQLAINRSKAKDRANAEHTPHPFVSLLFSECLERGQDITRGGAIYNITSSCEAGTITAANSLTAVKKAVFEDKVVALQELKEALRANFAGHEPLRQYLLNKTPKFGNDEDAMDEFVRKVVDINDEAIQELHERDFRGGSFVTGSGGSTAWLAGTQTGATPDGRLAGEALSVGLGPSQGTDVRGPTAMLNSVSKLNWDRQAGGALTHLKFSRSTLSGPDGTRKLAALLTTFFRRGGMGAHVTVVDGATLRAAKEDPEKHRNLLVRVGGFSAPFVLLSSKIQDNIIERTEQELS